MTEPLCRKCGTNHFNFQSCAEAEEKRRKFAHPQIEWRDDVPQWGDKLETIEVVGNMTWLKERPKRWQRSDQ